MCGKSQRQIATEIGYPNPNIMTMFKTGQTKIPIDKIPGLARSIGVDPLFLMRMAMTEYMPSAWQAIESVADAKSLISADELRLLQFVRESAGGLPIDLSAAESRHVLNVALQRVVELDQAKANAAVDRYNSAPPNRRFGADIP